MRVNTDGLDAAASNFNAAVGKLQEGISAFNNLKNSEGGKLVTSGDKDVNLAGETFLDDGGVISTFETASAHASDNASWASSKSYAMRASEARANAIANSIVARYQTTSLQNSNSQNARPNTSNTSVNSSKVNDTTKQTEQSFKPDIRDMLNKLDIFKNKDLIHKKALEQMIKDYVDGKIDLSKMNQQQIEEYAKKLVEQFKEQQIDRVYRLAFGEGDSNLEKERKNSIAQIIERTEKVGVLDGASERNYEMTIAEIAKDVDSQKVDINKMSDEEFAKYVKEKYEYVQTQNQLQDLKDFANNHDYEHWKALEQMIDDSVKNKINIKAMTDSELNEYAQKLINNQKQITENVNKVLLNKTMVLAGIGSDAGVIGVPEQVEITKDTSYVDSANFIFEKYKDNPEQFKKDFGMDMYITEDGKRIPNSEGLIKDMKNFVSQSGRTETAMTGQNLGDYFESKNQGIKYTENVQSVKGLSGNEIRSALNDKINNGESVSVYIKNGEDINYAMVTGIKDDGVTAVINGKEQEIKFSDLSSNDVSGFVSRNIDNG